KGAAAKDVKSAFRKLAKKLHPDANKTDPKAAAKFAELNAAYEILGDEEKRKAFDRGEIDAEGKPRFHGFTGAEAGGFGGAGRESPFETFTWGSDGFQRRGAGAGGFRSSGSGGFEDILKDVFGGMGARARAGRGGAGARFEPEDFGMPGRGADVSASLTITLPEAVNGAAKRIHLPNGK